MQYLDQSNQAFQTCGGYLVLGCKPLTMAAPNGQKKRISQAGEEVAPKLYSSYNLGEDPEGDRVISQCGI